MTDFFKSAFGMFGNQSQAGGGVAGGPPTSNHSTTSSNSSGRNEFVGQIIQIGNIKLRVTKMLAEGGFAIVYVVQDLTNGTEYALKVK